MTVLYFIVGYLCVGGLIMGLFDQDRDADRSGTVIIVCLWLPLAFYVIGTMIADASKRGDA